MIQGLSDILEPSSGGIAPRIDGGEVLAIADLHFSDVFEGKHKNYLENCCKVLRQILNLVEERKPKAVVFLGDLVGWTETNIRSREVFSMFCRFFRKLHGYCRIFVVRGNHDMRGYPDFQFLIDLGLVEVCDYFDYYKNSSEDIIPEVRFHIVNYGEEGNARDYINGASNVAFAHNNFTIDGVTTWYNAHDGIELGMQQSLSGMDMVISGHIHTPSPELVGVDMPSGKPCYLFYPGCPTRPINTSATEQDKYDMCWAISFSYNPEEDSTGYDVIPFELEPYESIFYSDDTIINEKTEEELENEVRKEALAEVLSDIIKYRMVGGNIMSQIDNIPNATDNAKTMAKEYLQVAYNNNKEALL